MSRGVKKPARVLTEPGWDYSDPKGIADDIIKQFYLARTQKAKE